MPYEIALVERLISELKDSLPVFSGRTFEQLSSDKALFETINAIIQLHELRLSTLVRRLFGLLESLARGNQSDERKKTMLQQSQLIVLRVVAMGMFYHWHQIYASRGINSDKALIKITEDQAASTDDASSKAAIGHGYNNGEFPLYYPEPLEESLAKYTFQIASHYFRSWSGPKSLRLVSDTVSMQAWYSFHLKRTHTSQSAPLLYNSKDIATGVGIKQRWVRTCLATPTNDLPMEIQEAAGAIFSFVSASNWSVAMQRAKSCLYLVVSRGDETADLTDIRFLEFASIDISRLVQIIDAFADVFPRVKRPEQLAIAVVLRRVIWSFISRCTGTFIDMHRKLYRPSTTRIEQLLDSIKAASDPSRLGSHPVLYQLQMLLLAICPDTVAHVVDHIDGRGDGRSKQSAFFTSIQQSLGVANAPEGAVLAALDLLRVAAILAVLPGNNITRLAHLLEADANRVLLDSGRLLAPSREEAVDSSMLLAYSLVSQLEMDPERALRYFLPLMTGPKSPASMNLVFAHAVHMTIGKRYYTNSTVSYPMFHRMVTQAFGDFLRKNIAQLQSVSEQQVQRRGNIPAVSRRAHGGGLNDSLSIYDIGFNVATSNDSHSLIPASETRQRIEIVATILNTFIEEPKLAIWGENEMERLDSFETIVSSISACIQEPSIAVQRLAGNVLRALFSPRRLADWMQTEDIAFAVWTLSLQVIQGICRALVHSMVSSSMMQHRQLLELMHDMMVLSNNILETSSGVVGAEMDLPENAQFEVAFEVVVMLHLWADDADTTQIILECIRLKCHSQQLISSISGANMDSTLANSRLYQELVAGDVQQAGVYSRVAQKKAVFRTIRKHIKPTPGAQAAWQETYKLWRQMLQALQMRDDTARATGAMSAVGGMSDGSVERDMANMSLNHSGSVPSTPTKDSHDRKEPAGKRRNPFYEKFTSQGNKLVMRAAGNRGGNDIGSTNLTAAAVASTGNLPSSISSSVSSPTTPHTATMPSPNTHLSGGFAGPAQNMDSLPSRTPGGIAAGAHLPAIINSPMATVNELRAQWKSCTGFLLASGGSCIPDGSGAIDRMGSSDTSEIHALLEHFVGETLELVVSDDILMRESAKEVLSNETHSGISVLLIARFMYSMKRFVQSTGEVSVSDSRTLFIGQCIIIMKALITRAEAENLSHSVFNTDLGTVLTTMSRYLNAAATHTPHGALNERIKFTRLVVMFLQSAMRQAIVQEVSVRNDLLETLVNWITELRVVDPRSPRADESSSYKRMMELTTTSMRAISQILDKLPIKPLNGAGQGSSSQSSDVRTLRSRAYRRYFDFFVRFMSQCRMVEIQEFSTIASAHAAGSAAASALSATGGGGNGGSSSNVAGVAASSANPMALRNRSNRSESFVATPSDVGLGREIARNIYSTTAAAGSQMTTLQQRVGRENAQDAELLLDLSIKALTKMLAANLEIGLQYSLTVVYHEDPKLRALFTNMFTDILREGIDIDSLSGDTPDHWKTRLIDMLVHPDLKLLLAINEVCQVQDIDELGAVLTDIFESRNSIKVLLERIITVELERTDSAAELFRRNCLATRLLSYFAKIHGDTYLKSTLGPALRKLMSLPPGTLTFELNPNKMSEMADRDRNLKNVERLCSLVIEAIVRSVHSMPAAFRSICNMIYRVVTTRFPDAGYTAVGGFIFLRFLCPAIVAPDSHGICAQIENPEIRRGLLLCTKITHNLANDVPFGNKETYMVPLNRFINENRPRILNFLSEIAELPDETDSVFEGRARSIASSTGGGRPSTEYGAPSEPDTDASSQIATGVDAKQFLVVQRFIFDHMDRLEAYLTRESMVRVQGPLMKPADRKKGSDKKSSLAASANPSATDANVSQSKTNVAETTGVATSTENLFTQVSYVMRQLGPPPPVVAENAPSKMMAEAEINSENVFYDILRRDAHRPTDAIAKKAIIYIGGVSREKRPVIYIIVRRLQMQYLDMDLVLLHIMRTLEPFANKSYEVFFDLTQFGPANEVPLQWLTQLRRIIPQGILHNAQSVYWYNVNTHFRKYVKHMSITLPPRIAKRSVFPHSLSDLNEFLASPQADLPPGTVSLDGEGGINISPVTRVSRSHAPLPCVVKVTPEAIQITAMRRQEVFGLSTYFNDVYHITEIADLQLLSANNRPDSSEADNDASSGVKGRMGLHRTASRSSESERPTTLGKHGKNSNSDEQLVSIRFEGGSSSLVFASPKADQLYRAIRTARTRYNNHSSTPAVPERIIRPSDVPGTLLNIALLNCGAEHAVLRISAYRMLTAIVATFNIDVGHELAYAIDLCLPPNPLQFIYRVGAKLAMSAPDMTLELLSEALVAFSKSAPNMRLWILQYIQPWVMCLGQYTHDSVTHPDALQRTQDIIRNLIHLHLKEPTMYMHFKQYVWSVVARVEDLTEIILDMFLTVAMEYGALTVETELIADMLATVAGKNPRYNKLVTRLRKLIAQTCTMSVTFIHTHQLWPEIAAYLRLLLPLTFSNRLLAEEYLPDVAFITCMLLKAGPGIIHSTLHGIVMHVVHSLALSQCSGLIIDSTFSPSITGDELFAGNPVRQFTDGAGDEIIASAATAAAGSGGATESSLLSPYAQLAQILADLNQPKMRFSFGLRSKTTSAVTFIASSYTRGGAASTLNPQALMEYKDELQSSASFAHDSPQEALSAVESIAQLFLRIMDNSAYTDGRSNSWRARWTTLVTSSTFVFNPAVQPRAFALLGKLASYDEVDDDLLYQTLATLRGALATFGDTDESLPISVLICLVSMVGNLPSDSSYLAPMFWLAIGILQIGNIPLYKVGLELLAKVLRALDNCGAFQPENGDGFEDFLMSARVPVEKAADQLDEIVGLSFRSSFPAALCLLLLKGMEDVQTKDECYDVVLQIVSIVSTCRKWQLASADQATRRLDLILPYLILILPTSNSRNTVSHVFAVAGLVTTPELRQSLEYGGFGPILEQVHRIDIAHKSQTDYILYPSIIAAMLHKTRVEHDIMILYSILASNITWADQSKTIMVIESLAPTISNMMHNSHSPKLTHKLHDIMVRLVVSRPSFDPDVFIQQQRLLQQQPSSTEGGSGHYDQSLGTRKSLNAAISSPGSSTTPATVAASALNVTSPISPTMMQTNTHRTSHAPPTRGRDDSGERMGASGAGVISRITDESSVLSAQSSSPSLAVPETTFDRSIMPAHREYLAEIGFSGLGRATVFETNMNHWRELAELTSMLVDHIL